MKFRAIALAAGLLAAHSAANAWFFFFLPTGAIVNAIEGDKCVSASAKVGDKFNSVTDGKTYVIEQLNGTSSRCANPSFPIVAKAKLYLSDAELKAQQTVCLPQGAAEGSRATVPELGEVQVVAIEPGGCSDFTKPISARVVRVDGQEPAKVTPEPAAVHQAAQPTPYGSPVDNLPAGAFACLPLGSGPQDRLDDPERGQLEVVRVFKNDGRCPDARPLMAEVTKAKGAAPQLVPVSDRPKKSVADRLRELKQLHDDGLITQDVYEAKQKDILSSQ